MPPHRRSGTFARVFSADHLDGCPVELPAPLGETGQQAGMEQVGQGHRHRGALGRIADQAHILHAQLQLESRRLVSLGCQDAAVVLIDGAVEYRLSQETGQGLPVDSALLGQGERLGHRLHGGQNQKIARQLHDIGSARLLTKVVNGLAHGLEQWLGTCLGLGRAGLANPQLLRSGRFWATEDRCAEPQAAPLGMLGSQMAGRFRRDGAHRDMQTASAQPVGNTRAAKGDVQQCSVVGQHGDDHAARGHRRCDRVGHLGACRGQRRGALAGAVVDRQRDAAAQHARGHGFPHGAQTDESDR